MLMILCAINASCCNVLQRNVNVRRCATVLSAWLFNSNHFVSGTFCIKLFNRRFAVYWTSRSIVTVPLFKEDTGASDSDRYVPQHWLSTLSAMFDTPFNGFLGAVSIGRSTGVTIPSPVSENVDIKTISTDHPIH